MRSIAREAAAELVSILPSRPSSSSPGGPLFVPVRILQYPATRRPRSRLDSALARFFGGSRAAAPPGKVLQDSVPNRQHRWERRLLPPQTCCRKTTPTPRAACATSEVTRSRRFG